MKPLSKLDFNSAKSFILPLALLAFTILLSRFSMKLAAPAREVASAEFPNGYTTRVLVDEATGIINYGMDWKPSISANGRYVAFNAPFEYIDYVKKAGYSANRVYVYDRKTGETVCVSTMNNGTLVDGRSPAISENGRYVAFVSFSHPLTGTATSRNFNIYVRDLTAGSTILVSMAFNEQPANGDSNNPSISADGRYVAFESNASNLVKDDSGQTSDIFVYDLKTGEMRRASISSDGTEANGPSRGAAISASGRYVAFYSQATNLAGGDFVETGVFLHDLESGKTVSITANQGIYTQGYHPLAIDSDGRNVVFSGNDVPVSKGEADYSHYLFDRQVYIYYRQSGKVESLIKGLKGEPPDSQVYWPSISADGRYVAFVSCASNLVEGTANGQTSIYVLDRKTGIIRRASASSKNIQADGPSYNPAISADGQHVVFGSSARNLVEGYVHGAIGVFMHDFSDWGDYPSIDARLFSQATPFPGPYPPPIRHPLAYPYPYPHP